MFDLNAPPPPAARVAPRRSLSDVVDQLLHSWQHDWIYHFDRDAIWIECQTCGKTTPGWALEVDPKLNKVQ